MNHPTSVQSFPEWQPPSPRSTPHSAKFSGYHFLSPPSSEPSPGFQHAWAPPQGYVSNTGYQTPGVYMNNTPEGTSLVSSLKRPRPISYQNVQGNGQGAQHVEMPGGPQLANPSMSFPSHSFLEQFHDTHIDNTQSESTTIAVAPAQVRTPPPARKTASRRKPQPSLVIPVETPSTILSRRSSDHEAWLKRSGNSSVSDASPFQFTPLQISPPDPMQFPSGPLTAPVYPHSQLFWDSNSNVGLDQTHFPSMSDNPFLGDDQSIASTFTFHKPAISNPVSAAPHGFVIPPLPTHVPSRPHSARPADPSISAMPPPPPRSATHLRQASSVDPSMLVSAQMADPNALSRPSSVVNNANPDDRQPYQYQLEALRREKEGRLKKGTRRQTTVDSTTTGFDSNDLRRNLTDSRARKTISLPHSAPLLTAEENDMPSNLGSGPITRNSSPLKRQKSSLQQTPTVSPLKPLARKSVVLTVDSKGIARAEVKTVRDTALRTKDSIASPDASSSESDSDSSDLPEGPPLTRSSSALSLRRPAAKSSPPSSDAVDALRDVVKANNQRKQEATINLDGTVFGCGPTIPSNNMTSHIYGGNFAMPGWDISPTAVTNSDLASPVDQDANYFTGTRCVCNNTISDAGRHMIQW